ncbi:SurA N-terminal domain-containing protein, partial [Acidobacteriota bacterium]
APALWFVIIAFIISIFAVWGGGGDIGGGGGKNTIAYVGKEKISRDFYYSSLIQRLQAMQEQYQQLDANFIQQLNIPQQVLEQIIQRRLLLQRAKYMKLNATDEEIRDRIISYPVFQKDEKFVGFEEYKKILNWNRISISDFEKGLIDEIRIDKVVKATTAGVIITEEEVWTNYKNNTESARIDYVVLETANIELDKEPEESEFKAYFETQQENYELPERREAQYIFFKNEDLKIEADVMDSEIAEYYRENEAQFKEPSQTRVSRIYFPFEERDKDDVKTEAQGILDRVNNQEDFGILAEIYSKDDKTSTQGDWGLFEWRSLPTAEQDAVNILDKDQNSGLIETEEGIAILKVTEKEQEKLTPLEDVKERITNIIKDQVARDLADKKAALLEKNAKKEKSLEVAAQKLGYTIQNTGLLKQGEEIEEIDPSGSLSSALFNLEDSGISAPVYTYQGVGIAQLTKVEAPRPATFDEVKDQIKDDFLEEKKKEVARERLNRVKAEISRSDLETLAQKYEMEFKTIEEHKRGVYIGTVGDNPKIDDLAFSMELNEISDPVEYEGGFTIIRVMDRKLATKEDFEKEKQTETDTLLEEKKNKYFQSFMAKFREDTGVRIRYDVFLQVNSDVMSRFSREEDTGIN